MRRVAYYNAAESMKSKQQQDPYLQASFSFTDKLRRQLWSFFWILCFRPSPRIFWAWRNFLLRCFGAHLGSNCHFAPDVRIWAPWQLSCADAVRIGDGVELYNPAPLSLGSHAIVSQGAYLCGASHDYNSARFTYLAYPTEIGAYAWVCAHAIVAPGVNLGEGAVLGLGAVATRDLEPWTVYAGVPAVQVKERTRFLE